MAEHSAIQWTDATVNFWWGCSRVSSGCDGCYADTWAQRLGLALWDNGQRKKILGAVPLIRKLNRTADRWGEIHGRRRRVFIQSMSDLFDKEVENDWLREALQEIDSAGSLEIQIVTKRISIVEKRLAAVGARAGGWPHNAGLIISVVNQAEADRDIPRLIDLKRRLGIPWVGLSIEPMLGPIILRPEWLAALDWVIVGGESGKHARPMHPDWVRTLRDQCARSGVAFLFKQWGEWKPTWGSESHLLYADGRFVEGTHDHPDAWQHRIAEPMWRPGKKLAGRLLDGIQHDGFPEIAHA